MHIDYDDNEKITWDEFYKILINTEINFIMITHQRNAII